MNDLESKQAAPTAAPGASTSTSAAPGRSSMVQLAEGAGHMANPLAGAGQLGLATSRYVGSVFGGPNAPGGGGAAPANAVAITAPPGSPAHRVQTAAAANNLAQVRQIQIELMHQQPRTAEITAGITAAREWMMERVAAIRDTFDGQLQAARRSSAAADSTHALSNVEEVEVRMNGQCEQYLLGLQEGDPQNRYLHHDQTITQKVFSAIRLRGARMGVDQVGHREQAEADARAMTGLTHGEEWCGAFAFTQAAHGGGLAGAWAENMTHERRIREALNYETRTKWIFAEGAWHPIRVYHAQRGSERHYKPVLPGGVIPPIEPGDIVLKDNRGGVDPDHITTAITSDGRHVSTIGGNEGTADIHDQTGVRRSGAIDLQTQPGPNDNRRRDANGHPIDGSNDPRGHKNQRVHGIGRWSIVDYEEHTYSPAAQMPTAPPAASGSARGSSRGGGHGGGGGAGPAPAAGGAH